MTSISIRSAAREDFESIARVTVAAYRADGQLESGHGYETTLADVAGRSGAGELLVAVDDATEEIVGAVLFVLPGSPYAELSGPGEAEFRMLAVDPSAQGRGVGETLVRACIARADELSCTAIVICVRDFTQPAQRLYHRLGFARVPEIDWSPFDGVHLLGLRLDLSRSDR